MFYFEIVESPIYKTFLLHSTTDECVQIAEVVFYTFGMLKAKLPPEIKTIHDKLAGNPSISPITVLKQMIEHCQIDTDLRDIKLMIGAACIDSVRDEVM